MEDFNSSTSHLRRRLALIGGEGPPDYPKLAMIGVGALLVIGAITFWMVCTLKSRRRKVELLKRKNDRRRRRSKKKRSGRRGKERLENRDDAEHVPRTRSKKPRHPSLGSPPPRKQNKPQSPPLKKQKQRSPPPRQEKSKPPRKGRHRERKGPRLPSPIYEEYSSESEYSSEDYSSSDEEGGKYEHKIEIKEALGKYHKKSGKAHDSVAWSAPVRMSEMDLPHDKSMLESTYSEFDSTIKPRDSTAESTYSDLDSNAYGGGRPSSYSGLDSTLESSYSGLDSTRESSCYSESESARESSYSGLDSTYSDLDSGIHGGMHPSSYSGLDSTVSDSRSYTSVKRFSKS